MPINVKTEVPADVQREAMELIKRLAGPIADGADFFTDKIRYWRWQSAMMAFARASELLKERGIEAKPIPLKFLAPFIEKASLEHESEMTDLWAELLTQASSNFDPLQQSYIEILAAISVEQAKILLEMYRKARANWSSILDAEVISQNAVYFPTESDLAGVNAYGTLVIFNEANWASDEQLKHLLSDSDSARKLLLARALEQRGLVEVKAFDDQLDDRRKISIWANLTAFGAQFIAACQGDLL